MAQKSVERVVLEPGVKHVVRKPVRSGNVKEIGYDEFCLLLEVEFHSGDVYQYWPVYADLHTELVTASSVGGFLNKEIVPHKNCRKIIQHDPFPADADYDQHHFALAAAEGMPEPPND